MPRAVKIAHALHLSNRETHSGGSTRRAGGATALTESFLALSLAPHFSRRVQNFEFRIYCLLKVLANEKDVQGMNMKLLDCYCALTLQNVALAFLCLLALHVSNNL